MCSLASSPYYMCVVVAWVCGSVCGGGGWQCGCGWQCVYGMAVCLEGVAVWGVAVSGG